MKKNKKAIFMETTSKSIESTAAEIQTVLKNYNLKLFYNTYNNGEIDGCFFQIEIDSIVIGYKLPVRCEKLIKMMNENKLKYCKTKEQIKKIAWRQIYKWIESQLALIETGMVEFSEIFLPYMLVEKNLTVFEKYNNNFPQLENKE